MLFTVLIVGGAIVACAGGIMTAVGNIGLKREESERQKALIDYERETLGRRDGLTKDE